MLLTSRWQEVEGLTVGAGKQADSFDWLMEKLAKSRQNVTQTHYLFKPFVLGKGLHEHSVLSFI